MKRNADRDLTRIGWLDYVLMSIGSCLAVYSAGMSIQLPSISYFCVVLVIVGTCVSYGVRVASFKSTFIKLDALFYGAAVVCAIFFSSELRSIMPDDGFPREIIAAGWLCWMLILGSFATWQDSTLLFQAIPALALFGLVGCYDTYRDVTFAFFGFVLCLATLFARAHGREMLRKSAASGYFTRGLAPGTPIPSVETTPGLALKLKAGPWRWVAGPEWALFSALGVVLVSLLGAPVIRQSVSGVAGFVRLNPPTSRQRANQPARGNQDQTGSSVRIGRPYSQVLSRPLMVARLDHFRYLRAEVYDTYTGKGWQNNHSTGGKDAENVVNLTNLMLSEMKDKVSFSYTIQLLRSPRQLALPPEAISVATSGGSYNQRPEGTYDVIGGISQFTGRSVEISPSVKPEKVMDAPEIRSYADATNVPARVHQLADQVTQGKKTDYDKALAIENEVSSRILYNLNAEETPTDRDPVDYTLFDLKQGYCTAFASAMVLMARAEGIPARYVQGYLPDERRHEADGSYVVTDADYHAWAELAFKDVGWVVFDPTINARAVPGEGLGDTGENRMWYQRGLAGAAFFVVLVAIAGGLVYGALRFVHARKNPSNVKTEIDRLYLSFNKVVERRIGRRRWIGETPHEFISKAKEALGPCYGPALEMTNQLVKAMYAPEGADTPLILKLREDLKLFKVAVKSLPKLTLKERE